VKHGHVLATAAPNAAFAREYVELGFRLIFFGTDAHLIAIGPGRAYRGDETGWRQVNRNRRPEGDKQEETAMKSLGSLAMAAMLTVSVPPSIAVAQTVTLHGAVQFNDEHAFNRTLLKFEELTKKYYGKPVNFVLHRNSELGLEKDYFVYLNQGQGVDYAIVSPAHMSTFSRAAPFIDAPFLFRDLDHWRKVLDADLFRPIADEIAQKADVMLIGYAGGGTRNIFANKPLHNLADMKGLKVRVMGAPIWSRTFAAAGMSPAASLSREITRSESRVDLV